MGGPLKQRTQTNPSFLMLFLAARSHDKAVPQPGFRMKSQPGGVGEGVNHLPCPPLPGRSPVLVREARWCHLSLLAPRHSRALG